MDFTDPKYKKFAVDNGCKLISFHKFDMALCCFLLAKDAVMVREVLIKNMKDIQLAYMFVNYLQDKNPVQKDKDGEWITNPIDKKPELKILLERYF